MDGSATRRLERSSDQLPAYTHDSRAFWTGGGRGELLIHSCRGCGRFHHPPAPICYHCLSRDVVPTPVSGRGEIVSFTVNHQPWQPGMAVPFVVAYVAIDEQPDVWLMTNIVDCDVSDVAIGTKVEVVFEQQEEVFVPLFKPSAAPVA